MNARDPEVTALPANVDAERSILGAILLDPKAYDEAASLSVVADDFFLDSHRTIYRSMQELAHRGSAIDMVTVISLLSDRWELAGIGDAAAVSSLIEGLPDRPSIKSYPAGSEAESRGVTGQRHNHVTIGEMAAPGGTTAGTASGTEERKKIGRGARI